MRRGLTEQQQAILEAVSQGIPLELAAAAVGVSPAVLYNWKLLLERETYNDGSKAAESTRSAAIDFYAQLPMARALGYSKLIEKLQHNATVPNPKTGWYDTMAIDKLLSKSSFRKDWYEHRERLEIEHRTVAEVHQQVKALSDEDLLELAGESRDQVKHIECDQVHP